MCIIPRRPGRTPLLADRLRQQLPAQIVRKRETPYSTTPAPYSSSLHLAKSEGEDTTGPDTDEVVGAGRAGLVIGARARPCHHQGLRVVLSLNQKGFRRAEP